MIGLTSAGNEGMAVYLKGKKPCLNALRVRLVRQTMKWWWLCEAKTPPWTEVLSVNLEWKLRHYGIGDERLLIFAKQNKA